MQNSEKKQPQRRVFPREKDPSLPRPYRYAQKEQKRALPRSATKKSPLFLPFRQKKDRVSRETQQKTAKSALSDLSKGKEASLRPFPASSKRKRRPLAPSLPLEAQKQTSHPFPALPEAQKESPRRLPDFFGAQKEASLRLSRVNIPRRNTRAVSRETFPTHETETLQSRPPKKSVVSRETFANS
ncbi:MAG: hypothetical protein II326_01005 [Clostridia bacterium]|nr:hypothetical protein [Clostridia bacterium]